MAPRELAPILALRLELLEAAQLDREVEVLRESGDVDGRFGVGVDVLVLGAVRDVQRGARLPVVPRAIDDAEAGATGDMDGFLAMDVPAGPPARGDLGHDESGALRGKTRRLSDEHRRARVLWGRDPLEVTGVRDDRTTPDRGRGLRARAQPGVVEVAHPGRWYGARTVSRPRRRP